MLSLTELLAQVAEESGTEQAAKLRNTLCVSYFHSYVHAIVSAVLAQRAREQKHLE